MKNKEREDLEIQTLKHNLKKEKHKFYIGYGLAIIICLFGCVVISYSIANDIPPGEVIPEIVKDKLPQYIWDHNDDIYGISPIGEINYDWNILS